MKVLHVDEEVIVCYYDQKIGVFEKAAISSHLHVVGYSWRVNAGAAEKVSSIERDSSIHKYFIKAVMNGVTEGILTI